MVRIRCEAPKSEQVRIRVSTVVAGVDYGFVGKRVVVGEAMRVGGLRRPGLALFAARCYRREADVLVTIR